MALSWFIGSTEYSLSDRTLCYPLGHTNLGMAPIRRLEERGPLQNGVTDRGYRYDARVIILSLGIHGNNVAEYYAKRTTLINIFKARNTPGRLRFTMDSIVREIEGHAVGDSLGFDDANRQNVYERIAVAIKCSDPRWYDPTMHTVTFNLGGGEDAFVVPYEVPYKMGTSTIDLSQTINYVGTVRSYPTIRITGPITNPVIVHNTTGFKLDLTGTTIADGDWYDIDLGYTGNTIKDKAGDSVLNDLSNDSDLVEFAIEPAPDVAGGVNSIQVTGSGINTSTKVDVNYYDMYIGI